MEEYCYADRSLMRQVFAQLVTDEGSIDVEVLNDDAEFLDVIRTIVAGDVTVAEDVANASRG